MMTIKSLLIAAAALGMTSVILGAFGAHALKDRLTEQQAQSFDTGVRYQMVHAVALLAVVLLAGQSGAGMLRWAGTLWVAGSLLFSGSIYLLATRELLGITSWKWLGPVTPLGGLCLIGGWAVLLIWAIRTKLY